ncbi:amidophosphoribosyltransferase [Bernardetia sp.]|uniref:amidophosphoribosyltransferase n=1 Tax=Bernardetia sp. TaxID=1937974 RepID=UPI0025C2301B|nr:amidophosphoribosyltransferase [Bernardetia sp.]
MSESLKHECGVAFLRLRKPLGYYIEKYGTPAYPVNKMFLLMEKQHNRGQDGAGLASIKIDMKKGYQYIDRLRSIEEQPINHIFNRVGKKFSKAQKEGKKYYNAKWVKKNIPFAGELFLGHLRYATYGANDERFCHPLLRSSNWRSRNLLLAGNFNMTNAEDLFTHLAELGQFPQEQGDTITALEKIGHFLDRENQHYYAQYQQEKKAKLAFDVSPNGKNNDEKQHFEEQFHHPLTNEEIIEKVEQNIDWKKILQRSCNDFDGGYVMVGMAGHGDAFVARDPASIRPAYYYINDEVIVAASEKPAIKTAFNCDYSEIQELEGGHALIVNKKAEYEIIKFQEPLPKKSCSFERIYFSRGTDPEIYAERKMLGRMLHHQVLDAIDHDLANTIFSYIPNTAETAFLGLVKGVEHHLIAQREKTLNPDEKLSDEESSKIMTFRPRVEKLVIKDSKMRTFITGDAQRDDMVAHVYDTTYEIVRKGIDTLVVIDDSIVRGTTLEKSILTMLDKLEPKKIVIVSSAPQIRFPDCYGIDMSRQHEFVVFRALLALLEERHLKYMLDDVYEKCLASKKQPLEKVVNHVKELYDMFEYKEVSDKVAEIISKNIKAEVKVVFQTVENLHKACPNHLGDWYFTGNYPTRGGNRVANQAFINFMEGKKTRAY